MGKKKTKGGVVLKEGPVDTIYHSKRKKSVLDKERIYLSNIQEELGQGIQKEQQLINEKSMELQAKRNEDFQKEQELESKQYNEKLKKDEVFEYNAERASNTLFSIIQRLVDLFVAVVEYIFITFMYLVFDRFPGLVRWIVEQFEKIINYITELFTNTKVAGAIVKGIVGMIVLFLCLLIVFLLIFYGISLFTDTGSDINCLSNSSKWPSLPSTLNINIYNTGNLYSKEKIGNSFDTITNYSTAYRPTFVSIPRFNLTFNDFVNNPFTYTGNYFSYLYNSLFGLNVVNDSSSSAKYMYNYTRKGYDFIKGTTDEEFLRNRDELKEGRCDNILNVDSALINNKEILKNKNIDMTNSVVNMGRPKDILWELPELEYYNSDFNKVPPSVLKLKDKNGVSLEDKKQVIIPWITKNNNYVLSCEDAYFKSNVNEKAKLLIDNDDESCTINIESVPKKYSENKKRYILNNDLSSFL